VVRSVVVFDPAVNGPWSFGEPELEARNGIRVTIQGTNPYTMDRRRADLSSSCLGRDSGSS
jgi:hypothetical protein